MTGGIHKYWGFISYSHRDRQWGEWLHKAIESYRVPARLAGTSGRHGLVPKKLFPIFRDRTELSAAGGLDVALQNALDQSRCLIIICSPASAASRWVNEEILYFKRRGGEDRILCLIVDGEPGASAGNQPERECFPPALRFKLGPDGALSDTPAEPLAADLREQADGRDGARLKILAGLLGVGFDDLKRRDLQTRNRRLAVLAGISTAVSAAMVVLAVKAFVAQKAAERSRQQGEDLISFMLGDLREKLEPLGKLEILDAVGDKAMGYFSKLDSNNLSEAALTARAKALRQIGDVRMQQGRAAEAAEPLTAALALNRQLVDRHPNNPNLVFELGQSEFYVGYAAWRAGATDDADKHWSAYLHESERLSSMAPSDPKWLLEVSYSLVNYGALELNREKKNTALAYFTAGVEVAKGISPQSKSVRLALADSLSWRGSTLQYLGDRDEALIVLREQARIFTGLASEYPGDASVKTRLTSSLSALAYATLEYGDIDETRAAVDLASPIIQMLVKNDPTNNDYRYLSANLEFIDASLAAMGTQWGTAEKILTSAESKIAASREDKSLSLLSRIRYVRGLIALEKGDFDLARKTSLNATTIEKCDSTNLSETNSATHLIRCANFYLMAAETEPDETDQKQNVLSRASNLINGIQNKTKEIAATLVEAHLNYLTGQKSKSLAMMEELEGKGYRNLNLYMFARRHCNTALSTEKDSTCDLLLKFKNPGDNR